MAYITPAVQRRMGKRLLLTDVCPWACKVHASSLHILYTLLISMCHFCQFKCLWVSLCVDMQNVFHILVKQLISFNLIPTFHSAAIMPLKPTRQRISWKVLDQLNTQCQLLRQVRKIKVGLANTFSFSRYCILLLLLINIQGRGWQLL